MDVHNAGILSLVVGAGPSDRVMQTRLSHTWRSESTVDRLHLALCASLVETTANLEPFAKLYMKADIRKIVHSVIVYIYTHTGLQHRRSSSYTTHHNKSTCVC